MFYATALLLVIAICLVMLTWDKWRALFRAIPQLCTILGLLTGVLTIWVFRSSLTSKTIPQDLFMLGALTALSVILLVLEPIWIALSGYNRYIEAHNSKVLSSVGKRWRRWRGCALLACLGTFYIWGFGLVIPLIKLLLGSQSEKELLREFFWILLVSSGFSVPFWIGEEVIKRWWSRKYTDYFRATEMGQGSFLD